MLSPKNSRLILQDTRLILSNCKSFDDYSTLTGSESDHNKKMLHRLVRILDISI